MGDLFRGQLVTTTWWREFHRVRSIRYLGKRWPMVETFCGTNILADEKGGSFGRFFVGSDAFYQRVEIDRSSRGRCQVCEDRFAPEYEQSSNAPEPRSDVLPGQVGMLRTALFETIGYDRLSDLLGYAVVHKDGEMELRRIDNVDVEPIMLLRVRDPATRTFCALRVPFTMTSCQEARNWTFGEERLKLEKEA